MLLIIGSIQRVSIFTVYRRIGAIASHIARLSKFKSPALFDLCQSIHLDVIRVLMGELRVRLLENEVVDILILFAILFLSRNASVSSEWPLVPIATRPIVSTSDHNLPLLHCHDAICIS